MNLLNLYPNKVPVKFDHIFVENKIFIINKNNVKNWPAVKSGFLTEKDAVLFLNCFFKIKNIYDK